MLHVLFANALLFKGVAKTVKTVHVVPETIIVCVRRNIFHQQAEMISEMFFMNNVNVLTDFAQLNKGYIKSINEDLTL